MKTFIYKEIRHHSRRNNRELTIYRVKNNVPEYVGTCYYSTASCRGAKHETFNFLIANGYIPKKYYNSSLCDWRGAGYFFGEVEKFYNIMEV